MVIRSSTSKDVLQHEGDNAVKPRGRPSKAEKAARRGRSMGRYPLMAAVNQHLERRKLKVGSKTFANDSRILRWIAKALEGMREDGQIKTTHPKEIGPTEIRAFINWMANPNFHNGKSLDPDTQVRYLSKLEGVLKENKNNAVERMRDEGYTFPQKIATKPIRSLSMTDLKTLQDASSKVNKSTGEPEGWRQAKACLLMTLYVATGLRPSELRLIKIKDVDLKKWHIYVGSPKGGGVWAYNRTITIMPQGRQELLAFLKERENLLRFYGVEEATYLIPNLRSGKDAPYSANHFNVLKREVQIISGIDFKLKDFRPTFASLTVEMDPNLLNDVSAQLGHSDTKTTQRYYARISAESAGSRLEKAWGAIESEKEHGNESGNEVQKLLDSLGMNSVEELRERLASNAQNAINRGIDYKNRLPGYN